MIQRSSQTMESSEQAQRMDRLGFCGWNLQVSELGISDETHELLIANCQEFCENRVLLGASSSYGSGSPQKAY